MTVRPAPGVSRIGLRTADGCFYPLMPETFRGVRQVVLTTAGAGQRAADVELFLEEPGGGERCQRLGAIRVNAAQDGGGRPDLVLRVSLEAGGVLRAGVTGPAGQGDPGGEGGADELRVELQRFTAGDAALRTAPGLAGVREAIAAGLPDDEPPAAAPAATAWRDAEEREDGGGAPGANGTPVEPFVHGCTSALPVNAAPHHRERVRWLAERPDLSGAEVDLLRSTYRRLAQDRDPARAAEAHAALRALDQRTREADGAGPAAGPATPAGDPLSLEPPSPDAPRRESPECDSAAAGASDSGAAAGAARSAFDRREYGEVLRLVHGARSRNGARSQDAGRAPGADGAIPADLADYWLDAGAP